MTPDQLEAACTVATLGAIEEMKRAQTPQDRIKWGKELAERKRLLGLVQAKTKPWLSSAS